MFVENYFQYTIFIHTFLIFSLYQYLSVVIRFNNKNNLVKNTYIIYIDDETNLYKKLPLNNIYIYFIYLNFFLSLFIVLLAKASIITKNKSTSIKL